MNKLTIISLLILSLFMTAKSQDSENLTRKEKKRLEEKLRMEKIQQLLDSKNFVFNVETIFPRGGGSINMGYDFDVQVKDELVTSYLPFIGTSYTSNLGGQKSGFDFTEPMENFSIKKKRKGFKVEFEVDNRSDHINFTLHVTTTGFATLSVASTQRQSISYYGTINEVK